MNLTYLFEKNSMMDDELDEALILRRPVTVLRNWLVQIYPRYVRGRLFGNYMPRFWLNEGDYCRNPHEGN